MNTISIIGCIVGIIGCAIGVATFTSAQLTKAKQDGVLIEKVDQCVKGIGEIKVDIKERNEKIDTIIDEHSKKIITLETQMKTVMDKLQL